MSHHRPWHRLSRGCECLCLCDWIVKIKGNQIRFVFETEYATNNMCLTYEDFSLPSSSWSNNSLVKWTLRWLSVSACFDWHKDLLKGQTSSWSTDHACTQTSLCPGYRQSVRAEVGSPCQVHVKGTGSQTYMYKRSLGVFPMIHGSVGVMRGGLVALARLIRWQGTFIYYVWLTFRFHQNQPCNKSIPAIMNYTP